MAILLKEILLLYLHSQAQVAVPNPLRIAESIIWLSDILYLPGTKYKSADDRLDLYCGKMAAL